MTLQVSVLNTGGRGQATFSYKLVGETYSKWYEIPFLGREPWMYTAFLVIFGLLLFIFGVIPALCSVGCTITSGLGFVFVVVPLGLVALVLVGLIAVLLTLISLSGPLGPLVAFIILVLMILAVVFLPCLCGYFTYRCWPRRNRRLKPQVTHYFKRRTKSVSDSQRQLQMS